MAEYIKRIDVMKICESYSEHCFNSSDAKGQDIADRILDDVVEIPTANVEEVKHGEWVTVYSENGYHKECSVCGSRWMLDSKEHICKETKRCYECGAKMDGREFRRNEI